MIYQSEILICTFTLFPSNKMALNASILLPLSQLTHYCANAFQLYLCHKVPQDIVLTTLQSQIIFICYQTYPFFLFFYFFHWMGSSKSPHIPLSEIKINKTFGILFFWLGMLFLPLTDQSHILLNLFIQLTYQRDLLSSYYAPGIILELCWSIKHTASVGVFRSIW